MKSNSQGGVNVQITNSLTVDLNIYDVYNPSTGTGSVPYIYTKLGTVAKGATGNITTIRNASMLQAMYTGAIAELDGKYYYQFPVKIMSGTQFSFGTPAPLAYTVAEADRLAMIQSFKFHKFATANPDSALTKNLYAALKSGKSDAINTYFAGTTNFQNCTYGSWNAVMSWMSMFTCAWQGPYYLYETAPTPLPTNYTPTLLATLNIVSTAQNNSATLTMCSADASGNPIFATPPQTTTIVMAGDGTMTDANPGSDVTTSLSPVWMNVISSTMQNGTPVANYLIGSAVCGTVAGQNVVSSQTARQIPGKPAEKSKQSTFDSIYSHLCSGIGLLAGLLMVYEFVAKKGEKSKEAKEEAKEDAKSESDFESQSASIDSDTASDLASDYSSVESTVETNSSAVESSYSSISESMNADVMTQTMNDEATSINDEISSQINDGATPTPEFETAVSDMQASFESAQSSIESGDLTTASNTLSEASTQMETAIETQGSQMQDSESSALSESSSALKETSEASKALDKAQSERESEMNSEEGDSGFDSDDTDGDVPTDDIPMAE